MSNKATSIQGMTRNELAAYEIQLMERAQDYAEELGMPREFGLKCYAASLNVLNEALSGPTLDL